MLANSKAIESQLLHSGMILCGNELWNLLLQDEVQICGNVQGLILTGPSDIGNLALLDWLLSVPLQGEIGAARARSC